MLLNGGLDYFDSQAQWMLAQRQKVHGTMVWQKKAGHDVPTRKHRDRECRGDLSAYTLRSAGVRIHSTGIQ